MKQQSSLLDVTMGVYDGVEVCELVGTYMLSLIWEKYNKNHFKIYRDDGLGVVRSKCGRETGKIKKSIQQIFKEYKLYIVTQCIMKIVDYFDVSLNLNNSNYKPYHKSDIEILYIHKDSSHQHSILKHIPTSMEKTISTFSSNENIFNESKNNICQKALEKSSYQQTLKYHPSNENVRNNKQNRKGMLFGLILHLVLISKQKSDIIFWI